MRSQKLLCGFPKRSEKTPEWHIGVSINILFTSHPRGLVAGKGNNPRFREGCSKAISFTVLQSNGFQVSSPHVKSVIFHCLSEFKFSFFFLQSILRPYKFCSGRCQRFICLAVSRSRFPVELPVPQQYRGKYRRVGSEGMVLLKFQEELLCLCLAALEFLCAHRTEARVPAEAGDQHPQFQCNYQS